MGSSQRSEEESVEEMVARVQADIRAKKRRKGVTRSQRGWEESVAGHVGRFIDRLTLDDILTISVGVLGGMRTHHAVGALAAAIGYRLATKPIGGTPPISQMVGVGILAAVGIGGLPVLKGEEVLRLEPIVDKPDIDCGTDCDLRWSFLGGWQCVPLFPGAKCLDHHAPANSNSGVGAG